MQYQKEQYHGLSKTRIYHIWRGMKSRCYDKNNKKYKHYGGRGITICQEWLNSFVKFRDYLYSIGYADEMIMDRINNDGNYTPTNVRLTTYKINNRNKRNNRLIIINNIIRPMSEWAELYGIKKSTFKSRYYRGDRDILLSRSTRKKRRNNA